jgi:hypothetical protein
MNSNRSRKLYHLSLYFLTTFLGDILQLFDKKEQGFPLISRF